MINRYMRKKHNLPSPSPCSQTPVCFFQKKEIIFIKKANISDSYSTCYQTGSDNGFHFNRAVRPEFFAWKTCWEKPSKQALIGQFCKKSRRPSYGILQG